jgi:hypothetical protein
LGIILGCLPVVGLTLVRGQVQTLLLLFLTGIILGCLQGRRRLAGVCIGAAVCLKLFPVFLFVLPVWRRDFRCLAAACLTIGIGLLLIPLVVLGPRMTLTVYSDYAAVLVMPALGVGGDDSRATELIDAGATQSQSFQVVLHKTIHQGEPRFPPVPAPWIKLTHWSLGAVLTLATLIFLNRRRGDPLGQMAGVGMLALVMVLLSPVCHLHYFVVGMPILLAVGARCDLEGSLTRKLLLALIFAGIVVAWSIPMVPGWSVLRNCGMPMYGALALWLIGWWARSPVSATPAISLASGPGIAA